MRLRPLILLGLLILIPATRAAAAKPKAPTLVLRLQALDEVVADVRYLAKQTGREDEEQFEKLLKSMTGEQGLEGLDPKKPMALYAYLGAEGIDSKVVLMLPIADKKVVLATLDRLGIKPKQPRDN